jgi:hypothetical protein
MDGKSISSEALFDYRAGRLPIGLCGSWPPGSGVNNAAQLSKLPHNGRILLNPQNG